MPNNFRSYTFQQQRKSKGAPLLSKLKEESDAFVKIIEKTERLLLNKRIQREGIFVLSYTKYYLTIKIRMHPISLFNH